MKDSFDSVPRRFGQLLGQYERLTIVVPEFQRGYSWEKTQVAAFWEDLRAFSEHNPKNAPRTYFLGPIVLMREKARTVLLDGQQRLATGTILFSVIRDAAAIIGGVKGDNLARDTQKDLIAKDEDAGTFALNLGELDSVFFRSRIQYFPAKKVTASLRSHRNIESAKQLLKELVEHRISGLSPEKQIAALRKLRDTLSTDLAMVAIYVDSEDDAYHIFETLNDRGLRLSVPDLLLNFLMRRSPTKRERIQVRESWSRVLSKMGRRDTDRFLRHMWLSMYGDLKARGLFHEIRTYIETRKTNSVAFTEVCFDECEAYLALIESDASILGAAACDHVGGIVDRLQSSSALPILLAGLRCLSQKNFAKLAKAVAALIVRHSTICNLNPSDLETTFYEGARNIRELSSAGTTDSKILQGIYRHLKLIDPDDAKVKADFANLIVGRNQALYLLGSLARHMQGGTKELVIGDGTLEHIYPQNADASWGSVSDLKDYVWHVGNLTLLGAKLNGKAANESYTKKRPLYKKSEIVMTKDIGKAFSKWDASEIIRRASELADTAVQIWKI